MQKIIDELTEILKGLLYVPMQIELGMIASICGSAATYFLGWNNMVEVLVYFTLVDYISGVLASYINLKIKPSSKKGFRGICKKVLIFLLVGISHMLDHLMGQSVLQTVTVWFFIGNEGLSILENADRAGVPIPKKLKEKLEQLKEEKGEENGTHGD